MEGVILMEKEGGGGLTMRWVSTFGLDTLCIPSAESGSREKRGTDGLEA